MSGALIGGAAEPERSTSNDQTRAIIEWAAAPERRSWAPAQGLLLTFRDSALEQAYRQFEYERGRNVIVAGLGASLLIMLSFLWLDPILAPQDIVAQLRVMRACVGIPATSLGFLGAIFVRRARRWIPWVSVLLVLVGIQNAPILATGGVATLKYLTPGVWNISISALFLCGLPLRWGMGVCATFSVAFAIAALAVGNDAVAVLNEFGIDVVVIFVFAAFATYRYERAARMSFVAQAVSQIEAAQRIAAESERSRWLEVIAAFLRHELKNAITGVSTSVELAGRSTTREGADPYLDRARRSVAYMRRLLAQVAEATSLEAALREREVERLNVAELVRDRIDDFRHDHPERVFELEADPGAPVDGDADSLIQMLDKLLNNAVEHGDPGRPIHVQVRSEDRCCRVVVSSHGDPLPADGERIFEPFVSGKRRRSGGNGLGLGLFVARTIARHHHGTVHAEPQDAGAVGARFVVELPRAPT